MVCLFNLQDVVKSNYNIIEIKGLGISDPDPFLYSPPSSPSSSPYLYPSSPDEGYGEVDAEGSGKEEEKRFEGVEPPNSPGGGVGGVGGAARQTLRQSFVQRREEKTQKKNTLLALFLAENANLQDFKEFPFSWLSNPLSFPYTSLSLTNREPSLRVLPPFLIRPNLIYVRNLNLSKCGLEELPPLLAAMVFFLSFFP